jgi:hypothetical protein
MAELIGSSDPFTEARTLTHYALFHKVSGRDREQILALLDNRTTADIERSEALRQTALAQLVDDADAPLSRSGSPLTESLDQRLPRPGRHAAEDDDRVTPAGAQTRQVAISRDLTKEQLYRQAKRLGIRGRSKMSKSQLKMAVGPHHQ